MGHDPGVVDKRLLAVEPEFASVLRRIDRDSNTLSPIVRQAWDSGNLNVLTKTSPARATAAHISIVTHITRDEVRRYLHRTEMGNGFANRLLWVYVERSKALPDGGVLNEAAIGPLIDRLKEAVAFARDATELRRDPEARAVWHRVYRALSDGKPGLLGAVIARAEAQVMRLACLYALLDCSSVIRREHLLAAIALWDYCEASARYIFGDTLGDPVSNELLERLRTAPAGLTRTDMRDMFGRNRGGAEIGHALGVLADKSLARCKREDTGGRRAERWYAVPVSTTETIETTKGTGLRSSKSFRSYLDLATQAPLDQPEATR